MTGYRQMRRHARQARRAGMQPMMVINPGDPLPELAVVVIARWAWRYRSELAPLGVACLVAGLGWYAHRALSPWWPLILAIAGLAAWVLAAFGAKLGIPGRLERLYVAVTVAACGTWDALAAALGPARPAAAASCWASAPWCWRSRGGPTAGAARRSAWNAPSPPGPTSPATSG